jgi:uncharacterized membrane protein YdjX (TVP38/TMEM64 family)
MVLARLLHLQDYLEEQRLRQFVGAFGLYAPLVYLSIWIVLPLVMPALPLVLIGGVLFGPVWGVVYVIIGATLGAIPPFLVARYLARDYVAAKIAGTRFANLDARVAEKGWVIVAITRIIPIFSYFVINYAYGLTRIPLWHYVAATAIFNLPPVVAYVYFASHILEAVRGQLSVGLLVGLALVILVSLLPFFYRKWQGGKADSLDL